MRRKRKARLFLSVLVLTSLLLSQLGGVVFAASDEAGVMYAAEESVADSEQIEAQTNEQTNEQSIEATEVPTAAEAQPEAETSAEVETKMAAIGSIETDSKAMHRDDPMMLGAPPLTATDRSTEFKINALSIKIGSTQICTQDGPVFSGNIPQFDITYGGIRPNIALTFGQVDSSADNVKEGDYIILNLCTVSGTLAADWSNLTTNQPIYNSSGSIQYATGSLYVAGNQLKLRIEFTDKIEGRNQIIGKVSVGADLNSSTGEGNLMLKYSNQDIAEIIKKQKGTNSRINRLPYKDYPGTYITNTSFGTDTIKWTMELNDYVEAQFDNATPLGDLIIEEALDYHQAFDTDSYYEKGLALQVYAPIYMMAGAGDTNKAAGKVYTHGMNGFSEFARLNSARSLDDMQWQNTEAAVKATPKSWTIVSENDPDNSGKMRERLVINLGSPTNGSGYHFSEMMKDPNYSFSQLLYELEEGMKYCKTIVDANTSQNDYFSVNGFSMKVWRASYAAYQASFDYYKNDPYVYNYKFVITTKVKTTQDGTRTIDHVYNTFTATRNSVVANETAAQANFWSSVIDAKAVKGDAQIFKADSLYGNAAGSKGSDSAVAGAMDDVEFEVYREDGTGPLRFTHSLDKYVYDPGGVETKVKIGSGDESVIMSGLDQGLTPEKYYLKEISDHTGYYSKQNQHFAFQVTSNAISYQLVNNVPRSVKLTKTQTGDNHIRLKGAVFQLYQYTKADLSDAVEVIGFTREVIGGTAYAVYDGTGSAKLATGADGTLNMTRLDAGKYFLKEVKAPSGYILSDQVQTFELTETLVSGAAAIVDLGNFANEAKEASEANKVINEHGKEPAKRIEPESEIKRFVDHQTDEKIIAHPMSSSLQNVLLKNSSIITAGKTKNGVGKGELELTKSVDRESTKPDDILTYTLVVKHVGDGKQINNITVKDYVPKDTRYVSVQDDGKYGVEQGREYVSWNIASLKKGETISLTFQVRVDVCIVNGTKIVNTAFLYDSLNHQKRYSNKVSVLVSVDSDSIVPQKRMSIGGIKVTPPGHQGDGRKVLWVLLLPGFIALIILKKDKS